MSEQKSFFNGLLTKPPIIFPLVGLFHVLWLIFAIWLAHTAPLTSVEWLRPLWMLGYTVCWIFTCDGRKWAAMGYVLITCLNLALYFGLRERYQRDLYTAAMFPLDLLFSFFVLFFYRRLTDGNA